MGQVIRLIKILLLLLSIVGFLSVSAESQETPQYKYVYPLVYLESYWRYHAYHSVVYTIAVEDTTIWIDTNFNGPDSSDKIYHLSKGESLRIGKAGGDYKSSKISTYFLEWEKNPLIIYSDKPVITFMSYTNGNYGVYDDGTFQYATPEPGTKLLGTNVRWLYITPYSEDAKVYINGKYEGVVKYGTVLVKEYSSPQNVVITSDKPVVAVSVYANKNNLDKTYAFPLQPPKSGKYLIPNSVEKYAKERRAIDVNEYYIIMDSSGNVVKKSKLPEKPTVISLEDSAVFVFRSFYYRDPWTGDYRYTMTAQTVKPVQEATLFGSIGPENMHVTVHNMVFYAEGEVKIYKDYERDFTIDSLETLPGGKIYKFSDRETNPDTSMHIYVVGNISGSFIDIGGWAYHIEGGYEIGTSPYSFQLWKGYVTPTPTPTPLTPQIKLYYNNTINFGEETEIKIEVYSDSKPIKANITLNINGEKVAETYSHEYTYKFKPDKIKEYIIEVIVEKDGIKIEKIGKITVIGDISEFLYDAESLKYKAYKEIDQAISITSEKAVDFVCSYGMGKATDKIMKVLKPITEFAEELVAESYRDNLGRFANHLGKMYKKVLSKALNEDVGIIISMGFSNVQDYAEYMFGKNVLEPISDVKNKKNTIEENTEKLKESILQNQEKILSNRNKTSILFFLYSKPIERVVEDKSLGSVTIPLLGKRYLWSLEGIANSYDFINNIKTGITVISIIIAVIIVIGALIIAAKSTAMSFGALLPLIITKIKNIFHIAHILSKGADILLATIVVTLILSTPIVVDFVEDEHENAVNNIIDAIEGEGTTSSMAFLKASSTYVLKPTYIKSNGYTVIVSPDGKILKVMKSSGYYIPRYTGKYKVFLMSHENKIFNVVKSTTFNAKKPNVTLSLNYTLIGKNLTVDTGIHNFENSSIENMALFLTVENSSGGIVYTDVRTFTLEDHTKEHFKISLNETDVYTLTATLTIMGIYKLAEDSFLINVGNVSVLDAVVEVDASEIYSPLENVTLNLTLKSSMPTDLEIVIPKFNYSLNTTVENYTTYELVLPKLTPGRYQLAIMAVKDGKILDADIVGFIVEAIDIAFLTFNKPKLYWSSGENITFNLTLTNFEDKPIDANVSICILGPYCDNISASKVGNHYQVSFALPENGTYIAKAYATKEGYAIKSDEIVFIVGNMSRLQIVVNETNIGTYVRVFANGMLTPCNLKVISGNETFNTYIDGRILLNKTLSSYTIVADKMFYEPGVYVKNLNPVAIFVFNPTKPVVGESIIFNASLSYDPDGKIVKYLWDFGDGNWTEGKVVNHSYNKPGDYIVTLTVVDDRGVTNSTSKTVTVLNNTSIPAPIPTSDDDRGVTNSTSKTVTVLNNTSIPAPIPTSDDDTQTFIDYTLTDTGPSPITKIVTRDIKLKELRYFVYRAKLIVGSEIDLDLSARHLKTTVDLTDKPVEIREDCILIGGPVANPTVRKYMEMRAFPVMVTNEYPGKNRGVIQVTKINGHTVVLLAGSDRWGTKAAVEYFKTLDDLPEEPIFVEWRNGEAVRIERP